MFLSGQDDLDTSYDERVPSANSPSQRRMRIWMWTGQRVILMMKEI